jgi:hypothetical protein
MLSVFIPWIAKHAPNCISHAKEFETTYKPINEMLQPIIDEHFDSHIPGQPRDFIDAYIDEMKATKDPSSSFYITESKSRHAPTGYSLMLGLCFLFARKVALNHGQ